MSAGQEQRVIHGGGKTQSTKLACLPRYPRYYSSRRKSGTIFPASGRACWRSNPRLTTEFTTTDSQTACKPRIQRGRPSRCAAGARCCVWPARSPTSAMLAPHPPCALLPPGLLLYRPAWLRMAGSVRRGREVVGHAHAAAAAQAHGLAVPPHGLKRTQPTTRPRSPRCRRARHRRTVAPSGGGARASAGEEELDTCVGEEVYVYMCRGRAHGHSETCGASASRDSKCPRGFT